MRRAALLALLLCAACKQQDAAVLIDITGAFRIPQDGNKLHLEVYDLPSNVIIRGKDWCAVPTAGCDSLSPMPQLSASVTLVQSGASHQHVKINVELLLDNAVVALGSLTTDFQSAQTVELPIVLTRPGP
ncbi:MAG: hypothetical protein ACXWLM_10940 [Myxococcales bacterium]